MPIPYNGETVFQTRAKQQVKIYFFLDFCLDRGDINANDFELHSNKHSLNFIP